MAQLDAGIGGGKLPVDGSLFLVALGFETPDGQIKLGRVANALFKWTTGQDAEFDFSHVQPGSMLRGVVKAQPRQNMPGQGRLKGLVQGCGTVRIEIVQNQVNTARAGILCVDQPTYGVGKILGSSLGCSLDMPPASQRFKEHEQIARAVALIFEILLSKLSWCGRCGGTHLLDELFTGLIKADHWFIGVVRLFVHVQHLFHVGHKGRVGAGNTPFLHLPGFDVIFFIVWRTVSCEMLSTTPSSTNLSASKRILQRAWLSGRSLQARATKWASPRPSNLRRCPGRASSLSAFSRPPSTKRRRVRSTVERLQSRACMISSSRRSSAAFTRICARFILRADTLPARVSRSSSICSWSVKSTLYSLAGISGTPIFPEYAPFYPSNPP